CRPQNVVSLSGVQPQTAGVPPPPQVSGALQPPQEMFTKRPQLSSPEYMPQFLPSRAHSAMPVSGTQPEQTLAMPSPPQVAGAVQLPQLMVFIVPQLSGAVTLLQFFASRVQKAASASGMQPQTFAVPAPPQVLPEAQVPQPPV